jgi:VWFA-related protein
LGFALLTLAPPRARGQLAPQPDAPPGQGEANFPPLSQPAQPQPQTQPAAPTQPQLNSQPPPTPAQPRATPPQSEQRASPESPNNPQSPPSPGVSTLRVSVNLVDLFFVVHDKSGKLVPNLTRADCNVFEDNAPQKLKTFTAQTDLPLSIGILLDTSLSQERVLPVEQKAASAFLRRILRPTDESFLISFDVTVDLLADWTSNPDDLKRALDAAQINSSSGNFANGTLPSITKPKGTLLYDAVYLASNDKLRQESGRKAMVLLTDGQDEGSDEKLQSAIEAAQKADAVVYVLLISDSGIYGTLDFSSDGAMRKLVEATGGEVFPIGKDGKKLPEAFNTIESQLRTEYQAAYTPSNAVLDGSYRHIRIACQQNGQPLKVQARQGYYAVAH